jgi:Tfp pilus assembly protein PilF
MKRLTMQDAFRLAEEHQRAGRFAEAENICNQILRRQPGNADVLAFLSVLARLQGKMSLAADRAREAVRAAPNIAEFHANYAEFLRLTGKPEESIATFQRAIQLKPNEPTFHNSLGTVYADRREYEPAMREYRRAIDLNRAYADAWNNLGCALRETDQLDEAAASLETAIKLPPNFPGPHMNLAIVRTSQERFTEAIESYQRAISLQPDFRDAHWSLGVLHLLLGDFERGWAEYRWRPTQSPRFTRPIWKGEDLRGKTILLHTEQGFGDTIQFVRYVPLLREKGATVLLRCRQELARLLSPIVTVLDPAKGLPNYDFHCAMLNLPAAFGTTLATIPASIPYLQPTPEASKRWVARLPQEKSKLRVGLAWAGSADHKNDFRRSITFEKLGPLLQTTGVEFFSLQTGPSAPQAKGTPIQDFTSDLRDFGDTAGLIDQLDLVITVDTAVAHLAGAMGKRVWVLLAQIPDWRWMLNRPDSPWYPTMRLFRQQTRGDWDAPIAEVAMELEKLVKGS